MNIVAFNKISSLFDTHNVRYEVFEHRPCGPSEEAAVVRKEIGIEDAVGAKALLMKLYLKGGEEIFATLVLPGTHKLKQSALKEIEDYKLNRFATADEMLEIAGVKPGCMPPFGKEIFPGISRFYICSSLLEHPKIAFNAAFFEKTIYMETKEYMKAVTPDKIFLFSQPK